MPVTERDCYAPSNSAADEADACNTSYWYLSNTKMPGDRPAHGGCSGFPAHWTTSSAITSISRVQRLICSRRFFEWHGVMRCGVVRCTGPCAVRCAGPCRTVRLPPMTPSTTHSYKYSWAVLFFVLTSALRVLAIYIYIYIGSRLACDGARTLTG